MYKEVAKRPAIAMLELIFAIVIIGIVLMSTPTLMQRASNSGYVTMQQEGINEAASQMNMIMSYYWDERNTESNSSDTILQTGGTGALEENMTATYLGYRTGTPKESMRNYKVGGTRLSASLIGGDGAEAVRDDIDDFDGVAVNLRDLNTTTVDNIEKGADINIATTVVYISDAPATGGYNSGTLTFDFNSTSGTGGATSNIKMITTTLTSTTGVAELDKTITLRSFSCNIGGTGELGWK